MPPVRNLLIWLLSITAGVIFIQFIQQEPSEQQNDVSVADELPDARAENIHMVRVENGLKTIETLADHLESYDKRGESYLTNPDVTLFKLTQANWHIVSDTATVFTNNDIHFIGNVVVTQLNEVPAMILKTDFLSYSEVSQRIFSDQAVNAVKGLQRMNAIGMEVELDTINPIIHLLSDVNLEYEPS